MQNNVYVCKISLTYTSLSQRALYSDIHFTEVVAKELNSFRLLKRDYDEYDN